MIVCGMKEVRVNLVEGMMKDEKEHKINYVGVNLSYDLPS